MIGEDGRMTDAAGERFAGLTRRRGARGVVAALRGEGRIARREPYAHTVPFSHRSGERDRAADLAAVVHAHGRARRAGDRGRADGPRHGSTRERWARATWTGWRTSAPGASRASCGGATGSRSGTAARRPTSAPTPPEGEGWERDPDVLDTWFSLRAVAVRDARLAARRRRSCGPSTRPTCSRRRATSSSSGSRAWS